MSCIEKNNKTRQPAPIRRGMHVWTPGEKSYKFVNKMQDGREMSPIDFFMFGMRGNDWIYNFHLNFPLQILLNLKKLRP